MEKAQKLALQGLSCRGPPACCLRRRRDPVAFPGPGLQAQAVPRQAPPLETAATSAEAGGSGRVPGARRNARGRLGQGGGRGRGGGGDAAEGAGREGGARAPIGQRGVPWPFMAAGPGHRSKTKGRRPAGRRREDASRRAGAPTARPRPGPRRDRLKAEPAPPEPGPDGRCGPGRGPPSGREYGRAPGGCSAATRGPAAPGGRRASTCWAPAGGRGGGAEDQLTLFCLPGVLVSSS